jgi:hypothetical protein
MAYGQSEDAIDYTMKRFLQSLLKFLDSVFSGDGGRRSEPLRRAGPLLMKIKSSAIYKKLLHPPHQSIVGLRHIKRDAAWLGPGKSKVIGKIIDDKRNIVHRYASQEARKSNRACSVIHNIPSIYGSDFIVLLPLASRFQGQTGLKCTNVSVPFDFRFYINECGVALEPRDISF